MKVTKKEVENIAKFYDKYGIDIYPLVSCAERIYGSLEAWKKLPPNHEVNAELAISYNIMMSSLKEIRENITKGLAKKLEPPKLLN